MQDAELFSYSAAIAVLALGITLILWFMGKKKRHHSPSKQTLQHGKRIVPRDEHPVSRRHISDNALKVVSRLNNQGFEAYLVGGCIRDLYLDLHPKDFDVSTSATPEEVRQLFRNSRLIGRRFKLVHIIFGREVIEVATFRASHQVHHSKDKSHHSESGRILRDNVYGSMEDDVLRRDFTVNALYYDSRDFSVVDFYHGIEDLKQGKLRLIGDPTTRYHEDPVRMLRAIRFAAKLGFTIDQDTEKPIHELSHLLSDIPAARIFDEILKLLQSGYAVSTFKLMQEYQLFASLFPDTHRCLEEKEEFAEALIIASLKSTEERIQQQRPVTPAFLFASLLWVPMRSLAREYQDERELPPIPANQQAAMAVIANQCQYTSIPRRFSMVIRDIWDLQYRLERRQPKLVEQLLEHPKFRAGYDFLLLREKSGEDLDDAGKWWTDIQEADTQDRHAMIWPEKNKSPRKKGGNNWRRRRGRKPQTPSNTSS